MRALPAVLFTGAALLTGAAEAQSHPFAEGRPVPALALPSAADGTPLSLTDFRGEKLVVHVFASW